jgi:hypothetical protein
MSDNMIAGLVIAALIAVYADICIRAERGDHRSRVAQIADLMARTVRAWRIRSRQHLPWKTAWHYAED